MATLPAVPKTPLHELHLKILLTRRISWSFVRLWAVPPGRARRPILQVRVLTILIFVFQKIRGRISFMFRASIHPERFWAGVGVGSEEEQSELENEPSTAQ
jgi:hypothetical protein